MPEVIAVDLGGTNIRAARVDPRGNIQARDKISTHASEGMDAVAGRIARLCQKLRTPSTAAIGIGTPGVPDPNTGDMLSPAVNIPGSAGYPLGRALQRVLNVPVVADNDGSLAALGETWKGAGKDEHVVMIFTLGTGIGGGVVIDGNVYHGNHNLGTEFGHVSIDFKGRVCPCGGHGCLEMYASAAALGRDAREALRDSFSARSSLLMRLCGGPLGIDSVDARMVCEAARNGDAMAIYLLDQCCFFLACGMGSLINVFNPSCVILGGGLALAGDLLLNRVQLALQSGRAIGPILRDCKFRMAQLGDDAGLLGAAKIALDKAQVG